jgi:TPP-dependent pyruvate/acetoin dehydrogenase alpha subunit
MAEAEQEIDAAVEFAFNSPDPDIAELWKDVL